MNLQPNSYIKRTFFVLCLLISQSISAQKIESSGSVGPVYGVGSAVAGGINLVVNVATIVQLSKLEGHKGLPALGLISGAAQITIGALNRQDKTPVVYPYYVTYINKQQQNLTYFNVGFGSLTVLLSVINLIANKQHEQRSISWNAESFQTSGSSMGFGVSLKKRF